MKIATYAFVLAFLLPLAMSQERILNFPGWPQNYTVEFWTNSYEVGPPEALIKAYFVKSTGNASADPVVLWLNGGPGCSSLLGFTKEIGPYYMDDGQTAFDQTPNAYGWTQNASIVFFESPPGVGYSIPDNTSYYDDNKTTTNNLAALVGFFNDFPDLVNNSFYIAGESYAGIYIPMLAKYILDYNEKQGNGTKINLKGILVGNGYTDPENYDYAVFEFFAGHQLMSLEIWDIIHQICPQNPTSPRCQYAQMTVGLNLANLNPYDVLGYCWGSKDDTVKNEKFFMTPFMKHHAIGKNLKGQGPPCVDVDPMIQFYNREDVKRSIMGSDEIHWLPCNMTINENYVRNQGTTDLYPVLVNAGLNIMVFSGDTDGAVPFTHTLHWLRKAYAVQTSEYTQWQVNNQAAGFTATYNNTLRYVTIKGTGHMAVQWKRPEGYHMFLAFINNQAL